MMILMTFQGCTSYRLKNQARELSAQGLYFEANQKWEDVYALNPDDVEIQAQMKQNRILLINQKLIKTRDLRNAKDRDGALEEMAGVIEMQRKWGDLDPNLANFQAGEMKSLYSMSIQRIEELLQERKSLAAAFYHKRYQAILLQKNGENSHLKIKIDQSGKLTCKLLFDYERRNLYRYFNSFVHQYCRFFDPTTPSVTIDKTNDLFSKLDLKYKIQANRSRPLVGIFENLQQSFSKTPWYNGTAKASLISTISGNVTFFQNKVQIPQTHFYEVSIPYTDYESVEKTRSGVYNGKPFQERYQENVPVTKYHREQRSYDYFADHITQLMKIDIQLDVIVHEKDFLISFAKDESEVGIIHNYNIPGIGLSPTSHRFTSEDEWQKKRGEELGQMLEASLNRLWQERYCTLPSDRDFVVIADAVLRCKELQNNISRPLIDKWFEDNIKLNYTQANEMLGSF